MVDYLLEMGYQHVSVLDISEAAINKAKTRLGDKAILVKWIVADINTFEPTEADASFKPIFRRCVFSNKC